MTIGTDIRGLYTVVLIFSAGGVYGAIQVCMVQC
jgi:hypothetical protein